MRITIVIYVHIVLIIIELSKINNIIRLFIIILIDLITPGDINFRL
jgi:hypothetical protein